MTAQPEPMVKRPPPDPNAIDLSAIHRQRQLEAWRKAHPELRERGNG